MGYIKISLIGVIGRARTECEYSSTVDNGRAFSSRSIFARLREQKCNDDKLGERLIYIAWTKHIANKFQGGASKTKKQGVADSLKTMANDK